MLVQIYLINIRLIMNILIGYLRLIHKGSEHSELAIK